MTTDHWDDWGSLRMTGMTRDDYGWLGCLGMTRYDWDD